MKRIVAALALIAAACTAVAAAGPVEMLFFYEEGCPHCHRVVSSVEEVQAAEGGFEIRRHEIHDFEARELLTRLLLAYGAELGPVPMVFIGDVAMVSETFYRPGQQSLTVSERTADLMLRDAVREAIATEAPSPLTRIPQTATEIILVTADACTSCGQLEAWLIDTLAAYPRAGIRRLSVDTPEDAELFQKLKRFMRVQGIAPALFVGETVLIGDRIHQRTGVPRPFSFSAEEAAVLEGVISVAVEEESASTLERLRLREQLTLWAVVGAAALDSVNPCDFAVLILLLGTLLVIGRKGKVLGAGIAFTAAIYISYFILGFLVYTILGLTVGTRGFREPFILVVSSLAILVGMWQMKDLLWYGKWLTIEVPDRWKPTVKKITSSAVTIPGAFVAGVIDSLFLAPCTSGPYLAILSLLSQTTGRWQGVGLLLLYNLIFILPLLAITLTVHLGFTTTARAERWRTARLGKLHFVSGVVMVLLGVGMILGLQFGYI